MKNKTGIFTKQQGFIRHEDRLRMPAHKSTVPLTFFLSVQKTALAAEW